MREPLKSLLWVFTMLLCVSVAWSNTWNIHSMVVFGDGNSDNGNSYRIYHIPASPPYWHHRFCNGPTWVEYLAYQLQLIRNPVRHPDYNRHRLFLDYSYYDATASDKSRNSIPKYHMTFNDEINQYLNHPHPYTGGTLVTIDIGQSDLFTTYCLANPLSCLLNVSQAQIDGMMRLCHAGIRHFLLVMPGMMEATPFVAYSATSEEKKLMPTLYPNYAQQFYKVANGVQAQCSGASVALFDTYQFDMQHRPNYRQPVTQPCYKNMVGDQVVYNKQVGPVCKNPNDVYYFDVYFTSALPNQQMARSALQLLRQRHWTRQQSLHWWQRLF